MPGIVSISPLDIDFHRCDPADSKVNAPLQGPTNKTGDRIHYPPNRHAPNTIRRMPQGTLTMFLYLWIQAHERGPIGAVHSKAMSPKHAHHQTSPRSNASTATKRVISPEIARNPDALASPESNPRICCQKSMERCRWTIRQCQPPRPPPPKR